MVKQKNVEISDAFWELVKPLVPTELKVANTYQSKRGGGRELKYSNRLIFQALFTSFVSASPGMTFLVKSLGE